MPAFEPFPGLSYDPDRVRLADVVAPPYDIISPDERAMLQARSPFNAIHLEAPEAEGGLDPYRAAHRRFETWERDGILHRHPQPAFYGYRMTERGDSGAVRATIGVIGALALEEPGTGGIFPHEHTTPKAKSDRLQLLEATAVNTSPIWVLSLASGLSTHLAVPPGTEVVRDDDGVGHESWPITDPGEVADLASAVASAPVVVADGHHRFETALAYRSRRRREAAAADAGAGIDTSQPGALSVHGRPGFDLVMALVVELTEDQLAVKAIHRLLSGLPEGFEVARALAASFDLRPCTADGAAGLLAEMEQQHGVGLVTPDRAWLLLPPAGSPAQLDAARLADALACLPDHEVVYQDGWETAVGAVESGAAQAAVMLRPVSVEEIAATARGGERMPPKTTFFWPKPRTGFVFRPLAR